MNKTALHPWHTARNARMHEFGGFDMPIQYDSIFSEHLATRTGIGLFDISHMGRFVISGKQAVPFLQFVLTNNVQELHRVGTAQYTILSDESGAAIDDAYLYRTNPGEFMLVVNAANRAKDWAWLTEIATRFREININDCSESIAMVALQGPNSERLLLRLLDEQGSGGKVPEPSRNMISNIHLGGVQLPIARTGYTGEPVAFELFPPAEHALALWEHVLEIGSDLGIAPVGLGARDTLRLEAGLPFYGNELGTDFEDTPIPIFALASLANIATSFSEIKGDYIGRQALLKQHTEVRERFRLLSRFNTPIAERRVPRFIRKIAVLNESRTGQGIIPVRKGQVITLNGRDVGWVTSGTVVPYRQFEGEGLYSVPGSEQKRRSIALGYVDSAVVVGKVDQDLEIIRPKGQPAPAILVYSNMRSAAPFSRSVLHPETGRGRSPFSIEKSPLELARELGHGAVKNSLLRQRQTVNLIPSEQTPSLFVRLLCGLDPAGRYAEHRTVKAFGAQAKDVYYYQGTDFIAWVEETLKSAFAQYLDCSEIEVRPVSGQMANKAVFSGLVDHLNRFGQGEPERIQLVMNNGLGAGGHLSAQYLGALKHFVRHNPYTDRPAVINFPINGDNPYRIDVHGTLRLLEQTHPQLIIFGKSMVLYPEPIREIADSIADWQDRPLILYDTAHVLGLLGPHFQKPFEEGADIVTGSTHKTYFGSQRGVIASNMSEGTYFRALWDKIVSETFPGSVSNHHLGTLLGLLGATYEMIAFGDEYQKQVILNAQAFASALSDCGLSVQGEASLGYTQTHQIILSVGKTKGPEASRMLEQNDIVSNYQALPRDSSFSEASGIRMGVQEMTRFGMRESDFEELAAMICDILLRKRNLRAEIGIFRSRFRKMHYCFSQEELAEVLTNLQNTFMHMG